MTIRRCENCKYYKLDNPYGGDIREERCECPDSINYNKYTKNFDGCINFEIKKDIMTGECK